MQHEGGTVVEETFSPTIPKVARRPSWSEQNIEMLKDDLKREQKIFDRKLVAVQKQISASHGKSTLKEIGQHVKQERARIALIFEKYKVQKFRQITKLELEHCKGREVMIKKSQKDNLREEQEAGQQSDDESEFEHQRQKKADEMSLLEVQKDIHRLEEHEMLLDTQLNAINTIWNSNDNDWRITANEQLDDDKDWDVASENVRKILDMMLSQSLKNKRKEYLADAEKFNNQHEPLAQKARELQDSLKREKEIHEKKLADLKADVYKRKATLKDMGEIMKRESAKLQRIWQKKEVEINQQLGATELPQNRQAETLYLRDLQICEEEEAHYRTLFRVGNGVNEDEKCDGFLHKHLGEMLLALKEKKQKLEKDLLLVREKIRNREEEAISLGKEMDAINLAMESYDEGSMVVNICTLPFPPSLPPPPLPPSPPLPL